MKGYSGCYACGATWDWAEPHVTNFSERDGCFPLCEPCWQALTPWQRLPYYAQLNARWPSPEHWPAIERAVLEGK